MIHAHACACGPSALRITDYGEDYCWVLRCVTCGDVRRLSHSEWRALLLGSARAEAAVRVDDVDDVGADAEDSARLCAPG